MNASEQSPESGPARERPEPLRSALASFPGNGDGAFLTGTVGDETFSAIIIWPEGHAQEAIFQIRRHSESEYGPRMTVEEAFRFIDGNNDSRIKAVIAGCVRHMLKVCREREWIEAEMFYLWHSLEREQDDKARAVLVMAMGYAMERCENFLQAVAYYQDAVAMDPTEQKVRYLAHNNLGFSLNQLGRYAEAEPYCRQAIGIDPDRHNAYKNLGVALAGLQRFAEAAECFLRAAEITPQDTRAAAHLSAMLKAHPEVLEGNPDINDRLAKVYGSPWANAQN